MYFCEEFMVFPGEREMKRRLFRRICREQLVNLLRKLAGKPPKPYSWETDDDSDPVVPNHEE